MSFNSEVYICLHIFRYVLLKERNMILTMEAEHARQLELMPSPERLEKVEESMENLLDVVQERNRAYNLLETGETGEPGRRWAYNHLGIGFWKKCKEHFKPIHLSTKNNFHGAWQIPFLKLWREKIFRERAKQRRMAIAKVKFIEHFHPHTRGTMKPDFSFQDDKLTNTMKGPDYIQKKDWAYFINHFVPQNKIAFWKHQWLIVEIDQ